MQRSCKIIYERIVAAVAVTDAIQIDQRNVDPTCMVGSDFNKTIAWNRAGVCLCKVTIRGVWTFLEILIEAAGVERKINARIMLYETEYMFMARMYMEISRIVEIITANVTRSVDVKWSQN